MTMRIEPIPVFLKIGAFLGAVLASGCADYNDGDRLNLGVVQIAERADRQTVEDRSLQVWMRVANQAIENGHPDTAIRFAQKAAKAFPKSDKPLRILALAFQQKNGAVRTNTPSVHQAALRSPANLQTSSSRVRKAPTPLVNKRAVASVSYSKPVPLQQSIQRHGGKTTNYRIQIAAYADLHDAMRGQRIVGRRLPSSFPPLGIFERTRLAAKGKKVNYRLRTLDLVSRSQARAYCKKASRAGLSCLPIRQTDNTWQLVQTGANSLVARATVLRPEGGGGKKTTNTTKKQKRVAVVAKPVPKKPARMRPAVLRSESLVKVQLAAYRNLARALNGKYILAKSLPDNFPALEILKRNGNTDDRTQINYWVRSRGLWQLNRARVLCKMARSAGHGCMLIEPERAARQSVVAHR